MFCGTLSFRGALRERLCLNPITMLLVLNIRTDLVRPVNIKWIWEERGVVPFLCEALEQHLKCNGEGG
jgi:hypothetical protein